MFGLDITVLKALEVTLCVILFDSLIGVFLSLAKGSFSFSKLPSFLSKAVLGFIGGLIVLAFMTKVDPRLAYVFWGAVAFVNAKYTKEALYDKFVELFNIATTPKDE